MTRSQNYDDAMPERIDIPILPVSAILKGSVKRYARNNAYIYRDRRITYEEIYRESMKFANALRNMGIGRGSVVSTHLPTCPQYIAAYYGIVISGATYSPINPYLPEADLLFQLIDSDTQVVITHESVADSVRRLFDRTKLKNVVVTGDQEMFTNDNPIDTTSYGERWHSFAALKAASSEEEFDPGVDPANDLVHIAYTGGTTGSPKGVMITHANLVSNVCQMAGWVAGCLPRVEDDGALVFEPAEKDEAKYIEKYKIPLGEEIRLSPSPLFHITGGIGLIVSPMAQGATTVLPDRFEPVQFLEFIEKYKVSSVTGAPAMWNVLMNMPNIQEYDFSAIRNVSSGAAPLSNEEIKRLQSTFPNARVVEGYGLTEATASVATGVCMTGGIFKLGTVGLPTFNTEIKVVSLDGESEEPLPSNQGGEICIRGPQVMKGYYKKPEETAQTIRNGWLHTGDIGMIDEDGYLAIIDRKKDMLIYNGYNIYPSRIEEILVTHPDVQNAIVIGKPAPTVGEIPKAFIILKPKATVTEEELMEFINTRVVHYSKIREMEFVDQFPMTAAGKISKVALKKMEMEKMQV